MPNTSTSHPTANGLSASRSANRVASSSTLIPSPTATLVNGESNPIHGARSSNASHLSSGTPEVPSLSQRAGGPSSDHAALSPLQLQLKNLETDRTKAIRIKEAAENLLSLGQAAKNESLRSKLETELESAQEKIVSITAQMDALESSLRVNGTLSSDSYSPLIQSARGCLKALISAGRSTTSPTATASSSSINLSASAQEDPQVDKTRLNAMHKLIGILQRHLQVRYELDVAEVLRAVTPGLSDHSSKECRAAAYRLVRHVLVDARSVQRLQEHPLDWYIVKSLSRDNKHSGEKEQAIKLIRTIVEIGCDRRGHRSTNRTGLVPLSEAVMRAVIAVAEHGEDPFRSICVETLVEILLIDVELIARTGGIRVLVHALGEGPLELASSLASAFLFIADSPRTRAYLSPGSDLEMALSAITDAYGKGPEHAERMRGCSQVIAMMIRTWSGLIYFCMDDMHAIRSIINTLRIPSLETREIVLDLFFDLLNIKTHDWFKQFIDGRRLTMYRRSRYPYPESSDKDKTSDNLDTDSESMHLTDQYIALLVLIFTEAGLLDALTAMLEECTTGTNLTRKATLLMAEVMQLANRLLPLSFAAKIQAISQVFNLASDYDSPENRITGTLALSAIDSFNRNRVRLQTSPYDKGRPRANSVEDTIRRGQRQVEQVKIKMGMQMDDKTFAQALMETQVPVTKDHTKWNYDTLLDLIEGPLLNPKRMEEITKGSKFMRRLLSFFHPFAHRFSDIPRKPANLRWIRLGCALLTTLLASPDGQRYLSTEDPLLRDIVKAFAQLDPFNGNPGSDPIFSPTRMQDTLTYGYFEMLGTLSRQKEGVELLEKFKVFTAFYHLMELRSREDLVRGIINHLDYSSDGHPRIVLSKALTSTSKPIRLYATEHLEKIITRNKAPAWTLRLLLTQLYDPAMEVCAIAVHLLEDVCESPEILRVVVDMQPTLEHLGDVGHRLMMHFMSTPIGFRYLYDAGYIVREMEQWFNERNLTYVVQVEVYLAKMFNFSSAEADESITFDGFVPPHFYGELAKTDIGCRLLQERGHFAVFSDHIRQYRLDNYEPEAILKLKSILWAVGCICSTEGGLPFLEEENILPHILDIACKSLTLSVRGTCFFVLGLLSSTPQGAEMLDDFQWEATLCPLGLPTGLCVPGDLHSFISIPSWMPVPDREEIRLAPPQDETEQEVLTAIYNLANTVIANQASRSLAKMKAKPENQHIFSSPSMLYRALHIISTQHYRLPVRRYILDLFEFSLDAALVKSLQDCAKTLRVSSNKTTAGGGSSKPAPRPMTIFGRPGRPRRTSESDEEESDDEEAPKKPRFERPVMSLRPMSKIVGFDR